MSKYRDRTARLASATAAAALAFPLSAAADGCSFRGEIVYADDYGKIVIERADPARGGNPLGPHAPLYPGDTLLVQADQIIWIRDEPGGELREVSAGDGRVTIGHPETCGVRDGLEATLGRLMASLNAIISGPVADQPVATYPVRGDPAPGGLTLAFEETQLVAEGLDRLSLHWSGLDATVMLRSASDDGILFKASSDGVSVVGGRLDRALRAGETLSLEFASEEGRVSRSVRVVPRSRLPRPPGVDSLEGLTPAEAAIYAIWLATEGPREWRLQGLTLLSAAAENDYLAWKVLLAIRARRQV